LARAVGAGAALIAGAGVGALRTLAEVGGVNRRVRVVGERAQARLGIAGAAGDGEADDADTHRLELRDGVRAARHRRAPGRLAVGGAGQVVVEPVLAGGRRARLVVEADVGHHDGDGDRAAPELRATQVAALLAKLHRAWQAGLAVPGGDSAP